MLPMNDEPLIERHRQHYEDDRDVFEILPWLDALPLPKRVISLGSNDEPLAEVFARRGCHSVGFDLRPYNRTSYPVFGCDVPTYEHRIEDWIADYPSPPPGIEVGEFDLVLAISSVEHFGLAEFGGRQSPSGDAEAIVLAHDALRVGGHCIITVPVGATWHECPHWRRYTVDTLDRLIGRFKEVDRKYFWTAHEGLQRKDSPEEALNYYVESADLTVGLLLRKEAA